MGPGPEARNGHISLQELDPSFRNAVSIVECTQLFFGGAEADQAREVRNRILDTPGASKRVKALLEDIGKHVRRALGPRMQNYFKQRVFLKDPPKSFAVNPFFDISIRESIFANDVLKSRVSDYRPLPRVNPPR